jgi:hypothetical protein
MIAFIEFFMIEISWYSVPLRFPRSVSSWSSGYPIGYKKFHYFSETTRPICNHPKIWWRCRFVIGELEPKAARSRFSETTFLIAGQRVRVALAQIRSRGTRRCLPDFKIQFLAIEVF